MKSGSRTARGFTLIELVVATVIIAIMATALVPLAVSSLGAYRETADDVAVLDKLRYATERLAREIRGVQYASNTDTTNPTYCSGTTTDTNHYCFTTMTPSSLVFRRSYTDSAGTVTWRTVTIGTSGSTVTLAYSDISGGARTLTDELGSLTFKYFKKDGTELVPPAALNGNANCINATPVLCTSDIEITLTLNHNGNGYTQRTRIGLRTLPI
jgi:MSHA biogenesis protein MshO